MRATESGFGIDSLTWSISGYYRASMWAPISSRRRFLQVALGTTSLSFVPPVGFALMPEDDRTAWYRDAKFGMFIHWGPYSLASVEASWPIMTPKPGGITEAEYRALPQRFNPIN